MSKLLYGSRYNEKSGIQEIVSENIRMEGLGEERLIPRMEFHANKSELPNVRMDSEVFDSVRISRYYSLPKNIVFFPPNRIVLGNLGDRRTLYLYYGSREFLCEIQVWNLDSGMLETELKGLKNMTCITSWDRSLICSFYGSSRPSNFGFRSYDIDTLQETAIKIEEPPLNLVMDMKVLNSDLIIALIMYRSGKEWLRDNLYMIFSISNSEKKIRLQEVIPEQTNNLLCCHSLMQPNHIFIKVDDCRDFPPDSSSKRTKHRILLLNYEIGTITNFVNVEYEITCSKTLQNEKNDEEEVIVGDSIGSVSVFHSPSLIMKKKIFLDERPVRSISFALNNSILLVSTQSMKKVVEEKPLILIQGVIKIEKNVYFNSLYTVDIKQMSKLHEYEGFGLSDMKVRSDYVTLTEILGFNEEKGEIRKIRVSSNEDHQDLKERIGYLISIMNCKESEYDVITVNSIGLKFQMFKIAVLL